MNSLSKPAGTLHIVTFSKKYRVGFNVLYPRMLNFSAVNCVMRTATAFLQMIALDFLPHVLFPQKD
jgi:hypothetical protein